VIEQTARRRALRGDTGSNVSSDRVGCTQAEVEAYFERHEPTLCRLDSCQLKAIVRELLHRDSFALMSPATLLSISAWRSAK
jgi:hypothetical protein